MGYADYDLIAQSLRSYYALGICKPLNNYSARSLRNGISGYALSQTNPVVFREDLRPEVEHRGQGMEFGFKPLSTLLLRPLKLRYKHRNRAFG